MAERKIQEDKIEEAKSLAENIEVVDFVEFSEDLVSLATKIRERFALRTRQMEELGIFPREFLAADANDGGESLPAMVVIGGPQTIRGYAILRPNGLLTTNHERFPAKAGAGRIEETNTRYSNISFLTASNTEYIQCASAVASTMLVIVKSSIPNTESS